MNPHETSLQARGLRRPRAGWAIACAGALLGALFAPHFGAAIRPGGAETAAETGAAIGDSWVIERLPADVQIVVRIRDADRQRRSAPGRALARAFGESQLFAETATAWNNLARSLQWDPEDAFTRLAGRRVILAIAGERPGGEREWAILSEIDPATERSLRGALNIAPRAAIAGQPVLSLEDGRFEMAVVATGPRAAGSASRTLVLAPAGCADLLDRIVRGLAGIDAGPSLKGAAAMLDARRLLAGDIFVLAMRPGPRPEHLAISASLAADGWTATLRASAGMFLGEEGVEPAGRERSAGWSAAPVERLAPGALAIMMSEGLPVLDRWAPLLLLPTLPEAAERLQGLLGGRVFLGVFAGVGEAGEVGPGSLVIGLDTPDARALSAPADAVLGRLVGAIQSGPAGAERDWPDFEGFLPDAMRVVRLAGPAKTLWSPMVGPSPVLTWVYASSPPDRGHPPGLSEWWVIAVVSGGPGSPARPLAREVSEALSAGGVRDDCLRRVSSGVIRIAGMVQWLRAIGADPAGTLAPLRCVERVTWDAWLDDGGSVEGIARIITADAP